MNQGSERIDITFSAINKQTRNQRIGQRVGFFNIISGSALASKPPVKLKTETKKNKIETLSVGHGFFGGDGGEVLINQNQYLMRKTTGGSSPVLFEYEAREFSVFPAGEYTFSFNAETNNPTKSISFLFQAEGDGVEELSGAIVDSRVEVTFEMPDPFVFLGFAMMSSVPINTYYKIWNIQLETGNRATAFTPYYYTTGSKGEVVLDYEQLGLYGNARIRKGSLGQVSVFKQEVAKRADGSLAPLTTLSPVSTSGSDLSLRDYKVENNRQYRYVVYPLDENGVLSELSDTIKTRWQGWSITELIPTLGDKTGKKFTVLPSNVWVFNLNVETGEQTQNMGLHEQETLGQFPRFTRGRQNFISGNVSCLLGREVLPMSYITEIDGDLDSFGQNKVKGSVGGYTEKTPFSRALSSNDRIDMLTAWRRLVFSNNLKLLKDRKGQSFLVVLTDGSNKPMDYVGIQPDTISFNWRQVGVVDDLQITGPID